MHNSELLRISIYSIAIVTIPIVMVFCYLLLCGGFNEYLENHYFNLQALRLTL